MHTNISKNAITFLSQIRRDTPHHLKNKRVQQGGITDRAANLIITNALKQQEQNLKLSSNIIPEVAEYKEDQLNNGKCLNFIFFLLPFN